uniref:Uncharacterized protein n=1 Tax=Rhizophora mucronata TaxID=61149 RepID=A0A2P2N0R9_RHIMU
MPMTCFRYKLLVSTIGIRKQPKIQAEAVNSRTCCMSPLEFLLTMEKDSPMAIVLGMFTV